MASTPKKPPPAMRGGMPAPKTEAAMARKWAAEDALRILAKAEEHKSNPKLMADVKALAAETAAKMGKIAKK